MRRVSFVLLYGILSLSSCLPLAAGEALRLSATAKGGAERVMVDVFVGDAEGQPVRGLTASDFQVFEDGQPVEVSSFFAVEDGDPRCQGTPDPCPSVASDGTASRLVFIFDQLSSRPEQRGEVLGRLSELTSQTLRPGDSAMVASFDGILHIEQRFTADAVKIHRALGALTSPGQPRQGSAAFERDLILRDLAALSSVADPDSDAALVLKATRGQDLLQRIERFTQRQAGSAFRTLDALQGFFATLAGVKGHKVVVLISDELALRPGEALFRAWEAELSYLANRTHQVPGLDPAVGHALELYFETSSVVNATVKETGSYNAARAFRRLGAEASAQRITFYALPLGGSPSIATSSPGGLSKAVEAGSSLPDKSTADGDGILLQELASATGGFVTTTAQGLAAGLERLRRDLRDRYTLGFLPRPSKSSEALRRLVVDVTWPEAEAPGVPSSDREIRYRAHHAPRNAMQSMEDLTLATLVHGTMENPLGLTVDLSTVQYDERGHQRLPILVKIPVGNLVLLPVDGHYEGRVSIHVGASGPSGQPSAIESIEVDIRVPKHHLEASQGQASVFGHRMTLEMNPGEHLLAVGVRDEMGDTEATTLIAQPSPPPVNVDGGSQPPTESDVPWPER